MHKRIFSAIILGLGLLAATGCTTSPLIAPASSYGVPTDVNHYVKNASGYTVHVHKWRGGANAVVFDIQGDEYTLQTVGEDWRTVTDQKQLEQVVEDMNTYFQLDNFVRAVTYPGTSGERVVIGLIYTPGGARLKKNPANPETVSILPVVEQDVRKGGGSRTSQLPIPEPKQ